MLLYSYLTPYISDRQDFINSNHFQSPRSTSKPTQSRKTEAFIQLFLIAISNFMNVHGKVPDKSRHCLPSVVLGFPPLSRDFIAYDRVYYLLP